MVLDSLSGGRSAVAAAAAAEPTPPELGLGEAWVEYGKAALTCDRDRDRSGLSTVHISARRWHHREFDASTLDWVDCGQLIEAEQEMKRQRSFKTVPLKPFRVHRVLYGEGSNAVKFICPVGISPTCTDRGLIKSFTRKSRQRLCWTMASIDRSKLECSRVWFVTLTYPAKWVNEPTLWKRHLNVWERALERYCRKTAHESGERFEPVPFVWKLEPQRRGAPHFHLLLVVPTSWGGCRGSMANFQQFLSESWNRIAGNGDHDHLLAGTRCEQMRSWDGVCWYTAKYLGKEVTDASIIERWVRSDDPLKSRSCGRFWGVRHKDALPICIRSRVCSGEGTIKLRRLVRKYLEKQGYRPRGLAGRVQPCSVYVPASIIQQAWAWAYPEEEVVLSSSVQCQWLALSASDEMSRSVLDCMHPGVCLN